jgi:hypothetical protein
MTPHVLDLDTLWRCMTSFTLRAVGTKRCESQRRFELCAKEDASFVPRQLHSTFISVHHHKSPYHWTLFIVTYRQRCKCFEERIVFNSWKHETIQILSAYLGPN